MTDDPVKLVFEKYRHLDHRIEILSRDRGHFINQIVQDLWFAVRDHIEEHYPEEVATRKQE